DGLAVRAEVFLRLAAPEDAGGKFVIFLPLTLIIHLLAAQLAAGSLELGGVFGRVHKLVRRSWVVLSKILLILTMNGSKATTTTSEHPPTTKIALVFTAMPRRETHTPAAASTARFTAA